MATLPELENALRKAHAAGNSDHARRFAAEIRRLRSAPDFSNVQADTISTEHMPEMLAPVQRGGAPRPSRDILAPLLARESVEGMSGIERFEAGVDSALGRAGRGFGQIVAGAVDLISPRERTMSSLITGEPVSRVDEMKRNEIRFRQADAPILETGAGRAGSFAGDVGLAAIPFARIGNLGRAQQVAAGAGIGGLYGFVQPVAEGESRAMNTGVSAIAGGVGSAVAPMVGGLVGMATRPFAAFTNRGANSQAAGIIRSAATDSAALSRQAPSPIPGVQRTLAEETADPGIAQLERQFPQELAAQHRANDVARVSHLRNAFGGASTESAQAQRTAVQAAQTPALREAKKVRGAESGKVISWIDRIENSSNYRGNTDVAAALGAIRGRIATPIDEAGRLSAARSVVTESLKTPRRMSAADFDKVREAQRLVISAQRSGRPVDEVIKDLGKLKPTSVAASGTVNDMARALKVAERGKDDVATLYEARKHITSNLLPRALKANDGATAKVLSGAVQRLDEQITEVAPGYRQYLTDYASGMRVADQITTGANIIKRTTRAGLDDRRLQSQAFLNTTDDLTSALPRSAIARRMTPERVLTPQQLQAVGAVRDDLKRVQFAQGTGAGSGAPVNSHSIQNLRTEAMIGRTIGQSRLAELVLNAPGVKSVTEGIRTAARNRINAKVAEILANPQQARAILAASSTDERRVIEAVLSRSGAMAAIGASE